MIIFSWLRSLASPIVTAKKCGHLTPTSGMMHAHGDKVLTTVQEKDGGKVDWCLECLSKMAIRCPCGKAIFIGDPVVAYLNYRLSAVIMGSNHESAQIGCMFCSDSAANICGVWLPGENGKGYVGSYS